MGSTLLQVWDLSSLLDNLAESGGKMNTGPPSVHNFSPLIKFKGSKAEGFAIDWSPLVPGRLISGIQILFLNYIFLSLL